MFDEVERQLPCVKTFMVKPYELTRIAPHLTRISKSDIEIYYDNESIGLFYQIDDIHAQSSECSGKSLIDALPHSPFPNQEQRQHIYRLTVNVTQACNLRCKYCYAEYGKYGHKTSPTDLDLFADTILAVIKYYYAVDRVQFFGGEPLLAPDKIELACKIFSRAASEKLISKEPEYSVVTNGIFLSNPQILKMLKDLRFSVTVSCDGPAIVTNALRPSANPDKGDVYSMIVEGVNAAQAAGIPVAIESTYTRTHQQLGISVLDVIDHAHEAFSAKSVHVPPAAYSPWGDYRPEREQAVEQYFQAGFESAKRVKRQESGFLDSSFSLLESLAGKKRAQGYCPAYTSQLSLDIKGDAYPCFMSMSVLENNLGNIVSDEWPNSSSQSVFSRYKNQMKAGSFGSRHKVWYDSLISACAAADFLAEGKFGEDVDADLREAVIAGTLLGIA